MCDLEVTLLEAWACWPDDGLGRQNLLWGLELYWWGRIGKMLQTVAIITVVLELVGPERLRRFAESLHRAYGIAEFPTLIRDALVFQLEWVKYILNADSDSETGDTHIGLRSDKLHAALLVSGWVTFAWYLWNDGDLLYAVLTIGAFTVCAGLLTLLLSVSASIVGLALDRVLLRPLAALISHPQLDHLVKLSTLILAVVGLHFDFLAS